MQMFTHPKYRRRGLATQLIDHLKEFLTQKSFTSISARVAEDLIEANEYWSRQHFYIQRIVDGGATRKRKILVRCHELASPQLFPSSGISAENPLGLTTPSITDTPLYLLDLNVLFDLSPRRLRLDETANLFQAERMHFFRLAISSEIRKELQRTANQGKTDPMESFINIFPSFPLFQNNDSETLITELASIVFPDKSFPQLSSNDNSDLRHIATVIQRNLAGLITNDNALLEAYLPIKSRYGIEVRSPSSFGLGMTASPENTQFETTNNATLTLRNISNLDVDVQAVHTLLSKLKIPGSTIATGWLPCESHGKTARCCGVWEEAILVGYLTWSARGTAESVIAHIATDENNPQALSAARILLIYLLEQLSPNEPYQVQLELPAHQSNVRDIAAGFGFCRSANQNSLSKIILGGVLTEKTWSTYQNKLANKYSLKLPQSIPTYSNIDQQIKILTPDGNQRHVTLDLLESLLSPALLCLPNRPAVITPVQRSFSEALLGHSEQSSLFPKNTASLFQERHYISSKQTLQHFKRGTLILFYESIKHKGRCEIVAIARVREAFHKINTTFDESDFMQSVLSKTSLTNIGKSKIKTVTAFDNIYLLPKPIPLKFLQRIGCGKATDLITTHPINNSQLQEILREAF